MNKDKSITESIFDNPLRIKLYLFVKAQKKPVGIRETQKKLSIPSASSVSWHFEKLVNLNYLIKNENNNYAINPEKKVDEPLNVQLQFSVLFIKDKLISPVLFVLSFLVFMLIFSIILWFSTAKYNRDPIFLGLQGTISLIITIIIVGYLFLKIQTAISQLSPKLE